MNKMQGKWGKSTKIPRNAQLPAVKIGNFEGPRAPAALPEHCRPLNAPIALYTAQNLCEPSKRCSKSERVWHFAKKTGPFMKPPMPAARSGPKKGGYTVKSGLDGQYRPVLA